MKVIITGATGMVGKGVLLECLEDDRVSTVLAVGRNKVDIEHNKLEQVIHKDFTDFSRLDKDLSIYDACFHCMGVSSIGMDEKEFSRLTFDVTKSLADACYLANSAMTFVYVTGTGTDSTEQGSTMWARVKGKAENYILGKGFKDAYMFRPGAIIPEKGIKSSTGWYQAIYVLTRPFYGLLKRLESVTTTTRLGKAMINTVGLNQELKHLENKDINILSNL